jgi:hypothetical protein
VSDDLIAFLRARYDDRVRELDEDERVALAAADWGPTWRGSDGAVYPSDESRHPGALITGVWGGLEDQHAEHIVRWDPERVLRHVADGRAEVEAKRRILDAHDRPHDCIAREASGGHSVVNGRPWEAWAPHHTADHGPCFVIRCLALPYADHPDYRAEWRPAAE